MSTSSSSLTQQHNLSREIMDKLVSIGLEFSTFQNNNSLHCPADCGKCCFKADIFCTPIEMLPMALAIFERGEGPAMLEKCLSHKADHCMFMSITNKANGKGRCTEYEHRPLVCRTFGVAGKKDKMGAIGFSVCTTLKEINSKEYLDLTKKEFQDSEVPFINNSKNHLATINPKFLEQEFPINESLAIMLEKILFVAEMASE